MWRRPLEWNLNGTTDPRDGSVDHLSLNSLKDRHGPIRAPKSRRTVVGTLCWATASTAYFCSAVLLPKALVDQGAVVTLSFGLSTLPFMVTIPGKFFTGFIMEIIGRRWTITYCLAGAVPGLARHATDHGRLPTTKPLARYGR